MILYQQCRCMLGHGRTRPERGPEPSLRLFYPTRVGHAEAAPGVRRVYDTKSRAWRSRSNTGKKTFYLNYGLPNERRSARWKLGASEPHRSIRRARRSERAQSSCGTASIPNPSLTAPRRRRSDRSVFGPRRPSSWKQHSKATEESWRRTKAGSTSTCSGWRKDVPVRQIAPTPGRRELRTRHHERHGARSSDVVRSLTPACFGSASRRGTRRSNTTRAAGTERGWTPSQRTLYPDDPHATRPGDSTRL